MVFVPRLRSAHPFTLYFVLFADKEDTSYT